MLIYMTESDHSALKVVDTFEGLAEIAIGVLARMKEAGHDEICEVCGPLSTGGLGTPDLNRAQFRKAIGAVRAHGYTVFDQLPFEDAIARIMRKYAPNEYCKEILSVFYALVFGSGYISTFFFIPDWHHSTGASWEHNDAAPRYGIRIRYIPPEWLRE